MRDIVPRPVGLPSGNKENRVLVRSTSSAGNVESRPGFLSKDSSVTKVTVEMKTVVTPQTSRVEGSSHFVTPRTPANLLRSRSNAAALTARKTPGSTSRFNQQVTTPASNGELTPGFVRRAPGSASATPCRGTPATTPNVKQARPEVTPVKRKIPTTPVSAAAGYGSKVAGTPVPRKVVATSELVHQQSTPSLSTTNHDLDEESHVTVAVRMRPLNQREKNESCGVVATGAEGLVTVTAENANLSFRYDHCFGPETNQSEVFRALVHPLLSKALEGYNACLFSYGQTGSGKTYSMMGMESVDGDSRSTMGREAGIIPRFGFSLFERLSRGQDVGVEVSYFEIYNEKIRDLLSEEVGPASRTALRVREHPQQGPYVEGLATHSVATFESLQGWLRLGLSRRATAASAMNDKSSRSHCIFSVMLVQNGGTKRSKVNLIDLAGSERLVNTSATGDRLREGVSINTSLLTLGKVITALADKQRRAFVPYRDSLLTWLLSDSLGGNARTVMLATISPARLYVEETLATLRYACQARAIINRPQVQSTAPTPVAHRQLQEEVDRLRAAREEYERRGAGREVTSLQSELAAVRQKLRDLEQERADWQARVAASEVDRSRQTAELTRRGVAECSAPALRLLTPDPSLSLCFALPGPGCLRKLVGTQQPPADIALQGSLIADEHCVLEWRSGMVWLVPGDQAAESYVNGVQVHDEMPLAHGDRLALGGELFLLVQLEPSVQAAVDFEWARMELSLAQNSRLNHELAEAKQQAILELESTRAQVEQLGASKSAAEAELVLMRGEQERLVSALQAEVRAERRRREMALSPLDMSIMPFTSNLLQELTELERGFVDAGAGLGLHEMRCLVREASQLSRKLGLPYVFGQVQQAQGDPQPGQPALHPCIRVRSGHLTAMCSPHTFFTLLDALRECCHEGCDSNDVVKLATDLVWEEEGEVSSRESSVEGSVTVDVAPFRRHLLSLSLTTHEESVNHGEVEQYLSNLHNALGKLQALTLKQPKVQELIKSVSNAICQLERACLHPDLESYQHSEPSAISHRTSDVTEQSHRFSMDSSRKSSMMSEIRPESGASGQLSFQPLSSSSKVSRLCSSLDVVLDQLRVLPPSEPSLSSSGSTVLHSPPSISAQPAKSNLRDLAIGASPSKEVRFNMKKKSLKQNEAN